MSPLALIWVGGEGHVCDRLRQGRGTRVPVEVPFCATSAGPVMCLELGSLWTSIIYLSPMWSWECMGEQASLSLAQILCKALLIIFIHQLVFLRFFKTQSQNHRVTVVERDLWRSPGPTCSNHLTRTVSRWSLKETIQGGRIHSFSEWAVLKSWEVKPSAQFQQMFLSDIICLLYLLAHTGHLTARQRVQLLVFFPASISF